MTNQTNELKPRMLGAVRMPDNDKAILVIMDRKLTDDELREFTVVRKDGVINRRNTAAPDSHVDDIDVVDIPKANAVTLKKVMEQVQVFASAWSMIGGTFDNGSAETNAREAKTELLQLIRALADKPPPELHVVYHRTHKGEKARTAYNQIIAQISEEDRHKVVNWIVHGAEARIARDGSVILTRGDWSEHLTFSPAQQDNVVTDREHAAIGKAIQRAAAELPLGFEIEINVEQGYAGAILVNPNGIASEYGEGNNSFSDQINMAIDAAINNSKGGV